MNSIKDLSPQQLRHAATVQEKILALQHELGRLLVPGPQAARPASGASRRLSAQGLANIRAGARRRWAKARAGNGASGRLRKATHKMSAAGRARIAAQLRARWAAAKKAGRNAL